MCGLEQMYSFGRLNPYHPFWAGFVHETITGGTFKRFSLTKTKIYSLEVTDEQYEKIKNIIHQMKQEKGQYKFNILGLFAAGFRKKIKRKKSFYCAEFVKYLMDQAKIDSRFTRGTKTRRF